MTTLTTILDCPFPMVRAAHLSDYRREQVLRLLDSINIEQYLVDDHIVMGELDHMLSLVSGHEGSPKYYVNHGGFCMSMDIGGFSKNEALPDFRTVNLWRKMTNIGHATDVASYTSDAFPHFRIIADLFSDNLRRKCVAEVAFLPVVMEEGPQRFFKVNSDFDDTTQRFSQSALELWERLEEMGEQGEKFEVYTNSLSNESFFRAAWTDATDCDTYSALVSPGKIFPSGSFFIYTEEKEKE